MSARYGPCVTRLRIRLVLLLSFCAFFSAVVHPFTVPLFHHPLKNRFTRQSLAQHSLTVSDTTTSNSSNYNYNKTLIECSVLGKLRRIRNQGEDEQSFLSAMAVPSFSASSTSHDIVKGTNTRKAAGLEGVLQQGPAFVLHDVLTKEVCEQLIHVTEQLGFGNYHSGKNYHGAMQLLVSQDIANAVGQILSHHVSIQDVDAIRTDMDGPDTDEDVRLVYAGLNRRWRIYRYSPGGEETFSPHIDAGFPPSGLSEDGSELLWDASGDEKGIVSRLTVLMYLNDDFVGGETKFYQPLVQMNRDGAATKPEVIASIRPITGSMLVFPQAVTEVAVEYARKHWPVHEGAPVKSGRPKYVIRSDILFASQREKLPLDDKLFQHDHLVRKAFLPQSPAFNDNFLNHISSLYNPHMGVENIGPFLYSFIRFTKTKSIVEIGAGYTSLWILQALKDNDDEMERVRTLQRSGTCRLLDWPWAAPDQVEWFSRRNGTLLCIDNCLHQKETATGATAIAKTLGLEGYMQFFQGDAFDLELKPESIDILWCDFGVGSRMKDFCLTGWPSIRPGGFLLCHSTITNKGTRDWLEATRARKGQHVTGIPPDDYVELSLLEPHKHYQNSISIFQKRKGSVGKSFVEPIYSEYA